MDKPFVSISCPFVDELFVDQLFRAISLKKVRCTASDFYDFSLICDIFLLNNRPKLAENV